VTDQAHFPTELLVPDEYWAPDQRARIVETTRRLADLDAAIVLQRSGALAYWAVVGCAEALSVTLPPKIEILIGREISGDFEERTVIALDDYAWRVRSDTPLPLQVEGDDRSAQYYDWLEKRARRPTSQVSRVIHQLGQAGIAIPGIRQVMIVDDSVYQGSTLFMTAPFVVNKAMPEATINATWLFSTYCAITMLDKNFPRLNARTTDNLAATRIVAALLRGSVDYRGFLEPLTAENIHRVGRYFAARSATQENLNPRNPVPAMVAQWGMPSLLSLPQMAIDAMKRYGQSLV
jgi:hypothetical protein